MHMAPTSVLHDEPELARVLIEKKFISRKSFVEGDIRFTLADRRNRNVKITLLGAGGLFTKQAKTREALTTLRHEAAVLDLLNATQDGLNRHIPRKISFDPELGLLVIELIPNGRSLHEVLMQSGKMEPGHARTLGVVLAGIHNRVTPDWSEHDILPPYTLGLNTPHYTLLNYLSPANLRLLEAIQNDEVLSAGMDDLRANWQPTAFIHGDAKLDNIVVAPDAFLLVDWELATVGDPRWDVGSVFSSFLSNWIASMPMAHGARHDLMAREARLPLDKLQAASRRFWHAYATTSGLDLSGRFRDEATAYCGGRLVQTAYEYMQVAPRLTANAIYMIQMAANILKDPRQAADFLLGKR
jgi:tRNA A-37 threonylcarbamoyl transferase component Bud32